MYVKKTKRTERVHWPIPGGCSSVLGSRGCPDEGAVVSAFKELGKQWEEGAGKYAMIMQGAQHRDKTRHCVS